MARQTKKTLSRGERNIKWIESNLRGTEGKFLGKPLRLADFQKNIIRKIYDNPAGTKKAIISVGRKNGKTYLTSTLMLLHLCGPEAQSNKNLYSTARSRDQASILFNLALKIVRASPAIAPYIKVNESKKMLTCTGLNSKYQALSSDAKNNLGHDPFWVAHDELGAVKGPIDPLFESLETATSAQESSLSITISTQAASDSDLLSNLIDDALTGADPQTVLALYTCPPDVDWTSEEAILAANPAIGTFAKLDELKRMQKAAMRLPARASSFKNLNLNMRVEATDAFIDSEIWKANGSTPESWIGKEIYIGLDLSITTDLTSLTIVHKQSDDKWAVDPMFWIPEDGLIERSKRDKVPYDVWDDQGLINTTQGRVIEYDFIAQKLLEIDEQATIKHIAFDRYNIKNFKKSLLNVGFNEARIEELFGQGFGQGYVSFGPAVRDLENAILKEELAHGNHPVLTWCMTNIKIMSDPAGNRKYEKKQTFARIDGAVTLTMAIRSAIEQTGEVEKPKTSYLSRQPLMIL